MVTVIDIVYRKVVIFGIIITGVDSTGWLAKCCFESSSKEFSERGRVQGMVIMVFALAGMVTVSVLMT